MADTDIPTPHPAGGEAREFLALDELPLADALNYRPSLWWRVRSTLRQAWADAVCVVRGHRWEQHGGRYWTDCGWEYDSHTECARCGRGEEVSRG